MPVAAAAPSNPPTHAPNALCLWACPLFPSDRNGWACGPPLPPLARPQNSFRCPLRLLSLPCAFPESALWGGMSCPPPAFARLSLLLCPSPLGFGPPACGCPSPVCVYTSCSRSSRPHLYASPSPPHCSLCMSFAYMCFPLRTRFAPEKIQRSECPSLALNTCRTPCSATLPFQHSTKPTQCFPP